MKSIHFLSTVSVLCVTTFHALSASETGIVRVPPVSGANTNELPVIEFVEAPIQAVLDYYGRLTGRSVIAATNVVGVVNFRSQSQLTREETIQALDSVLTVNGYIAVPMGEKLLKIVPFFAAKQEAPKVGIGTEEALPPSDALVTRVVALQLADVGDVVGALQPYLHSYGQLVALPKSNSILVTDSANNVSRILEILAILDRSSRRSMETKVYVIKHARAVDLLPRLQAIVADTGGGRTAVPGAPTSTPMPTIPTPTVPTRSGVGSGGVPSYGSVVIARPSASGEEGAIEGKVIITSDERTNKIIVHTRAVNFPFFDKLIEELDSKVEPEIITKVFPLQNGEAPEVAQMLTMLISGIPFMPTTRIGGAGGRGTAFQSLSMGAMGGMGMFGGFGGFGGYGGSSGSSGAAQLSAMQARLQASGFMKYPESVRILPDSRTNALLIMASREDMTRLDELVTQLDAQLPQVLIEVIIGEVTLTDEREVGVDIVQRVLRSGQMKTYGGTRTGTEGPPAAARPVDLSPLAAGASATPAGAAISSALTYFATFQGLRLDLALRLLTSDRKFRVLSTPIIQTLHNQQGSIIVGESRPVITATLSSVSSVSSTNQTANALQSNVEFKDIAIELIVTPRVNPDGYVTMDIDQRVNDLSGTVNISGSNLPVISKREAKSTVMVKDQNTIILGGLIKQNKQLEATKVPFLGDIPFFGALFRDKHTIDVRSELIVFIRPTVLRDDAAAGAEARRRTEMLDAGKELDLHKKFLDPAATNTPPAVAPIPKPAPEPKRAPTSNFGPTRR
jgi:general secretion pathway protein D